MSQLPAIRATLTSCAQLRGRRAAGRRRQGAQGLAPARQPDGATQAARTLRGRGAAALRAARARPSCSPKNGELLLQNPRAPLFTRWSEFEQHAAELRGMQRGRLKSPRDDGRVLSARPAGAVLARLAGIEIELAVENRDAIVKRLEQGEDELAVMMLPPPSLPLERWPFLENPLVWSRRCRIRWSDASGWRSRSCCPSRCWRREPGSGTRPVPPTSSSRSAAWPGRRAWPWAATRPSNTGGARRPRAGGAVAAHAGRRPGA